MTEPNVEGCNVLLSSHQPYLVVFRRVHCGRSVNVGAPIDICDAVHVMLGFDSQIYGVIHTIECGFFGGIPKALVEQVAPTLKDNYNAILKHPKVSDATSARVPCVKRGMVQVTWRISDAYDTSLAGLHDYVPDLPSHVRAP